MKDEYISAFAFKTARKIEDIIEETSGHLKERNRMLEGKILEWYVKSKDEDFANHFGIIKDKNYERI